MREPSDEMITYAKFLESLNFEDAIREIMNISSGYILSRQLAEDSPREIFIHDYCDRLENHMLALIPLSSKIEKIIKLIKNLRDGQSANEPVGDEKA